MLTLYSSSTYHELACGTDSAATRAKKECV